MYNVTTELSSTSITEWFGKTWATVSESVLKWLANTGVDILKSVLLLIIGFWIAAIVARGVRGALKRTKVDKSIVSFISSCVKVLLRLIVVVMAVANLGLDVASLITALGAAGITVGLAMQDSLSNFASGVLILFNKPFVAGDYVELEDSSGTVKEISLMYTTLVNTENKEVIYPNSSVTAAKIINHTALSERRVELQFTVSANSDVQDVKDALNAAVEKSPAALSGGEHAPIIGVRSFGNGYINFDLRVWIKTSDYWPAYYDIEERVLGELTARGIAVPHDLIDVNVVKG